MATYTWDQWTLYSNPIGQWSSKYTASADVTVSRSYGSSTATLSITATMTTQTGDSNTLGWKCWVEVGGTWQSFDIAPSGVHYQNTSKTASQTYTVSVGDSAGTLTGGIKFQICGFTGNTGEYSETKTYSLAYGSKGPTELTSVTNRYYGSAATFTLSRKANNMRESITMVNGGTTLTIRTTSDTATTFTYTLNRSYTPTTAYPSSSSWTITISTYDGATLIGTKTYTYSWEIASSDKSSYTPTLSANPTCQAYNDVVSALSTDTAVAGYSKLNVNAAKSDVSLKYNATISSRVVTFSNGSSASSDTTAHYSSKIMSAGTVNWTYTVTDSRGLTVTRTGSYNVISANAPVITATVYRGNSGGTAQDGGPYIFVTATATYDSLSGHNSVSLQANVDSGTYTNITSGTRATLKTDADAGTSYTVHVKATDLLQTTTNTYKVTAKDLPINVAVGGNGVGIGTKASSDNTLKVGYDAKFYGDIIKHDSVNNVDADLIQLTEKLAPTLATGIGSSSNLNTATFCNVGQYFCGANVTAATLTNCPTSEAFIMNVYAPIQREVDNPTGYTRYRVRKILAYGGAEYVQQVTKNTSDVWSFGDWYMVNTSLASEDGNVAQWLKASVRRPTSLDFTHIYDSQKVHARLDQSSSSLSGGVNSIFGEGYVLTFMWDTNKRWDSQFFIPDADGAKPAYRVYIPSQSQWGAVHRFAITDVTKTDITSLTNGATILSGYGGCYYEVCNNLLHLHIACSGLTANTEKDIYTMPSGYRPSDRPTNIGIGGDFSSMASVSRLRVLSTGKVTVNSTDTSAIADLWYYI